MTQQKIEASSSDVPPIPESGSSNASKTPLFEANHADRYQRQTLIKQIQEHTKRSLICYVSGIRCVIDENDTMPFVDLLHKAPPNHDMDPQLGLVVEHREYHSAEWQSYWRLYCLQRLAVEDRQKLYESDCASLVIGPAG